MQFSLLLCATIGGALGSALRYSISQLSLAHLGQSFYGTLAVNLIGCFLIGLLSEAVLKLSQHQLFTNYSPYLTTLLITGLLGGFTTFSSFALDTLGIKGEYSSWLSLAYITISVFGGISLAQLGRLIITIF
ncbi:CrcB protein [Piscirickettsia salmonis]|uniref:Fluoride-specific ion channel FluC n=1 Tax=Piscirickettsia salmonis TaxID=1238 RepID=A0A9Q5YMA9_PISSA|nr:CrcB family protein [Piscirickettsia salmonis]RNC77101.1 CrcB family protein [Piscirickettsiaceae bacterium NZ-RLO2]ALA24314.1 crcB-like family protein [Piscirickettsia salmonis]APS44691.1 CrcB protein [Piscirickettsia salmonis]APS48051.1 CrcB protein [Piscirickettsia salmonis]APS52009.1 CrcB protein [Piscirickettsia salmonis]